MDLKLFKEEFTICKIDDISKINLSDEIFFIGKTDEELSLVCRTEFTPDGCIDRENGWRGFRFCGKMGFSEIGILARVSGILASNRIGIFVVSTFNTDYVFVKKYDWDRTVFILTNNGYQFKE
ncbi:MAG: ACT domain-containing protein [Flexilinea sp.]